MRNTVELIYGRIDFIEKEYFLKRKNLVHEYLELTQPTCQEDKLSDADYESIYALIEIKKNAYYLKKGIDTI